MLISARFEEVIAPCDLWILPTPRFSRWFAHLDWYMNWQMCKGLAYGGLHLPAETYRVAEQYGVAIRDRAAGGDTPLLIATGGRVPAPRCLVADASAGLNAWLAQVGESAGRLQIKEARVFLPTGENIKDAEKHWRAAGFKVQFSPDMEAGT